MQTKFGYRMKTRILCALLTVLFLASCGEYNKILKSRDPEVKYEYAKKYFDEQKYGRTCTLLEEILSVYAGTSKEQEVLYLLAQSYFYNKDYTTATVYYNRYVSKFPKGEFTEMARYNSAYGLYLDSPDARLDQTNTVKSIQGFQEFLEYYPQSSKVTEAQNIMFELQEKLAYKEFLSARLYFNLGLHMGNNYESCVVTAREALKQYPFSEYAEGFQYLIVKAKYELAENSIEEKKQVRYRDVMDEYFNYKNMFPNGKHLKECERYYRKAVSVVGEVEDNLPNETVKEGLSNKEKK